jgi:hypothetical protein
MIKTLFLAAALLVPDLAYAGDPSAVLSTQVVPAGSGGGIACDQGPNYTGSIPALAQQAGFTHCALNADFTSTTTDGNGINFSNTSTYISECGATTAQRWYLQYWAGLDMPCNRAQIVADPTGGGFNVLTIAYTLADQALWDSTHTSGYATTLAWPGGWNQTNVLPWEMYVEFTVLFPTATINATAKPGANTQMLGNAAIQQNAVAGNNYIQSNYEINTATGGSGGSFGGHSTVICSNPPSKCAFGFGGYFFGGFDDVQYHTVGSLVTSDETRYVVACDMKDGVSGVCIPSDLVSAGVNPSQIFGLHNGEMMQWVGKGDCLNGGPDCQTADMNVYFKSMRIWVCPNYKTQVCGGAASGTPIVCYNPQGGSCPPGSVTSNDHLGTRRMFAENITPVDLIRKAVVWVEAKIAP